MAEINLDVDLTQVNAQIEDLVTQLNKLNADREQLTQSIHNLNGIAMYLRGKLPPEEQSIVDGVVEQTEEEKTDGTLERVNEYPS